MNRRIDSIMRRSLTRVSVVLVLAAVMLFTAAVLSAAVVDDNAYAKSKSLKVTKVEYDHTGRTVEFKFNQKVKYKKVKVTIKYRDEKNMVTKVLKKDSTSLKVKVKKLKYCKLYSYKITGIRKASSKKYVTLKGYFRAIDWK